MSKTIGNMTLKAAPVGTDMVAIADSEDSDKTKKVLLSALGGGGSNFQYYYELKNVAYNTINSNPLQITADCDGLNAYVPGIYVLTVPSDVSAAKSLGVRLNINGLGYIDCNILTGYTSSVDRAPTYLFQQGGVYILIYNYDYIFNRGKFYLIYASTVHTLQDMTSSNSSTESVDLSSFGVTNSQKNIHKCWKFGTLTSLILSNSPIADQGFEQEIQFTTDSTFTFTATGLVGKWLGVSTPTFEPNTSYVIAIKNGYAVCAKVGA